MESNHEFNELGQDQGVGDQNTHQSSPLFFPENPNLLNVLGGDLPNFNDDGGMGIGQSLSGDQPGTSSNENTSFQELSFDDIFDFAAFENGVQGQDNDGDDGEEDRESESEEDDDDDDEDEGNHKDKDEEDSPADDPSNTMALMRYALTRAANDNVRPVFPDIRAIFDSVASVARSRGAWAGTLRGRVSMASVRHYGRDLVVLEGELETLKVRMERALALINADNFARHNQAEGINAILFMVNRCLEDIDLQKRLCDEVFRQAGRLSCLSADPVGLADAERRLRAALAASLRRLERVQEIEPMLEAFEAEFQLVLSSGDV
ncbi:hypothetical protein PV08_08704 [Exophiala spinifera]|uniref:Uncharacterized protein n=1 Tax=Exophiala spinifera TaxID=91928 RepID=A0A0D1YEP7_9EURO|nr:uncharacterized protein PV08_08704 [Exophiala spinifera]KIW13516.1 hypothetical protein PV08_08704 [Exophiala spinifera]